MFLDRLDYIRKIFGQESPLLKRIRETGGDKDRISIHPEEGRLLQLLIRLGGFRKIVEIGTLAGYSALRLAEALPADGHLYTMEKDDARAEIARKNFSSASCDGKISLLQGNALDLLPQIEEHGPFDMAFIDADKLNYLRYLDWAEKNVRKGGIIAGDNTFLFDAVWKDGPVERVRETARQTMRQFNLRLADPEKYLGVMLPTEEGLTVALKLF